MTELPAVATDPRRAAHEAGARWRLPFHRQAWRGVAGGWLGSGTGNSLDFQDHRSYVPGDDPRHIHWQAYARTGALTMKLYRAEVAPRIDLVVDVSASMACSAAKARRTDELLAFCVGSADRAAAPVRVHAANGRELQAVPIESVRAGRWRERIAMGESRTEAPGPLPWRSGAMKMLISDLLFPGDPAPLLTALAAGAGLPIVLAPALAEEADLPWRGNVELQDCESSIHRRQRIDEALAAAYRTAYARHFQLWREVAQRRGVTMTRIPCEGDLARVLGGEALASGAVEAAV